MTAFLRVADAMEENNPELKVWVKQVQEAAYDIEDVLELFVLRLGHRHVMVLDFAVFFVRYVFPISNCGSPVVLTTRNADLASIASTEYYGDVYNLQPLPSKESWTLFCRKTFMENSCPSHLERLSKAILNRRKGLPLAIVAISGLLSTKDKSSVDEWNKIYCSLGVELEGNDKLRTVSLTIGD
ncbi:Disease resistance protein RPM1 [Camellia lanceoleosa]|uniref:Disease resistance protein RPM1 n=1 Tax=Camellia lanceoleosa TaxID=1840588 RepID=A0ACC0HK24_9ERIC|nr:Disease resistance protein RPM1 [Camellia lanceoleosa]